MTNTMHTSEPTGQSEKQKGSPFVEVADLRDYFAAKAMQGMFSNDALLARYHNDGLVNMISPEVLAVTAAYSMADAMLAERAK